MKVCPVCEAHLKEGVSVCSVCDSDLHVVRQFGELPATLKTMANDAVQAKDPARAIAYYKIAMEMEPQDIGLLSGIARASELGGELVGAQEAWRQVLAVDPTHPEALEHFSLLADRLSQAESSPLKAAAKRGHFFLDFPVFAGWTSGWGGPSEQKRQNRYPRSCPRDPGEAGTGADLKQHDRKS